MNLEAHLSRCPLAADILELCEPAAAEGRGNGPLPISAEEEKVPPRPPWGQTIQQKRPQVLQGPLENIPGSFWTAQQTAAIVVKSGSLPRTRGPGVLKS